jgi:hypothetical protein
MTVTFEIAPDVEQAVKAQAIARGIPLEDYLPSLIAQAAQETVWEDISAARRTMVGMEPIAHRLWDTPEEDDAWRDL